MKISNTFLKFYAITLTFILGFFMISSFKSNNSEKKFDEITVERINIVEPDGKLKMVISNQERQHPGMMDGNEFESRTRPAGMIFFNEEQDEVGGLIYQGNKKDGAFWALSVDQFKNDQVMQMRYHKNAEGRNSYGLHFWDRSSKITLTDRLEITDSLKKAGMDREQILQQLKTLNDDLPVSADRFFVGQNFNKETGLFIKDEFGNDRMNIYIDENNQPKFIIYDEEGNIVKQLTKE